MNSVTSHSAAKIFFVSLLGAVILRGIFNSIMPLSGEEAYYWMWSRHPDLCYFDHPPLIAWVIGIATGVFGHSVFAVRLPALLSNTLTALIIFLCTLRITKDRVVAAWAGGFFLVAVFFAAMATLAIPDSYLFLLWSLTLWLTIEATRGERPALWIAAGAALGLCMLTKFHGILLALSILLYLLISHRQRKQFRSGWLYLGMGIAALCTLPILVWNVREGWPTFTFQLSSRQHYILGNPVYLLEMLTAPFAFIGIVLFPLSVAGAAWGLLKGVRDKEDDLIFLSVAFILPYAFFLLLSIFIKIDSQWSAPAFVSGIVLAAMLGRKLMQNPERPRWQQRLLPLALKVNILLLVIAYVVPLLLMFFPDLVPRNMILVKHRHRKFNTSKIGELYGWQEIGQRLKDEIALLGGPQHAFIFARIGWCTASNFCFYSGGEADVFIFDRPPADGHQFFIWERRSDPQGMNAVVIAEKEKYINLDFLQMYFERVERLPDLVITRSGLEQRRLFMARAWNLRTKPNQL
ncbi:MAG: 4-amino-4-deoxy-L-arabinose transferase [Deltaproteobacteria bacterium]|nr:4-amino-4-deoxy-L-arabinose transferase [Deltaproteobacteria bacterium]